MSAYCDEYPKAANESGKSEYAAFAIPKIVRQLSVRLARGRVLPDWERVAQRDNLLRSCLAESDVDSSKVERGTSLDN
jgi:hypothetical protein